MLFQLRMRPLDPFLRPSLFDEHTTARRENGHLPPSDSPSIRHHPSTPAAASRSPALTARGRALSRPKGIPTPLFPIELDNSQRPSPDLPRTRRNERGPARRETAGFAMCAPQPRYPW